MTCPLVHRSVPAVPEEERLCDMSARPAELLVYGARAGGQQLSPPAAVVEEGGGRLACHQEQVRLGRMN